MQPNNTRGLMSERKAAAAKRRPGRATWDSGESPLSEPTRSAAEAAQRDAAFRADCGG